MMTSMTTTNTSQLALDVLQQFRVIYGTMRLYFKEVEDRCGFSGSQMWVLQEVSRSPGLGVTELSLRMGIHQSTCSQMIEKLVTLGCLQKDKQIKDHRRVGLFIAPDGLKAMAALPGPAEGVLPHALSSIPTVALQTLQINLSELIKNLPGNDEQHENIPLADLINPNGLDSIAP